MLLDLLLMVGFLGAVAPLGLAMSLSPSAFLKYGLGIA